MNGDLRQEKKKKKKEQLMPLDGNGKGSGLFILCGFTFVILPRTVYSQLMSETKIM